jgi:selenocysteine lyase/cysteine desulfurase
MSGRGLRRDEFLATAAGAASLGGVAGYLLGRPDAEAAPPASAEPAAPFRNLSDWANVRALFELSRDVLPFASFLLAAHPRPVRAAIAEFRAALDAEPVRFLHENERRLEAAVREAAAAYLGTSAAEVALTDSTTMGLGLVYRGLEVGPGDELVTTEHDFYATHEALRGAAERTGATVRRITLYEEPEEASVEGIVGAITAALGPRTRCLALTWVHSSTGVKLPLREIAAVVRDANRGRPERDRVFLSVDGVHGFGVEDASPASLGCDVFVTGCHKWLFGPRGTGIVWAMPAAWRRLQPTIPSFDPQAYSAWLEERPPSDASPGPLMTPGGFHSFEHRWALAAAFSLHEAIGHERIAARTRLFARQLKEGLTAIRGVTVKTPLDERLSAGLVCCELARLSAPEAVDRLRLEHRIEASVTPYRTLYLRLGPSIVNTPAEVERVVDAVAALA